MKKQQMIFSTVAVLALIALLYAQKVIRNDKGQNAGTAVNDENKTAMLGSGQGDENHPDQPPKNAIAPENESVKAGGQATVSNIAVTEKKEEVKKENNCFKFSYQHESKNQNRDIEDFLNDTNAFPIASANVNQKSICVRVNNKPVNHKLVKKEGKTEVVIGSVVGPDSTIQVSYCVGNAPCKESCVVKSNNKVDELISDSEMGGLENAELETQVKELRNVASVHGNLMDSAIIRDWNKLQSKEWICEK
jgi:hypothetical protein